MHADLTSPKAFTSSLEHLLLELERLNILLRVRHWQMDQRAKTQPVETVEALLDQRPGFAAWNLTPLTPEQIGKVQGRLDDAAAEIDARCRVTQIPLRLERLGRLFDLSPLEKDILLIALAPTLDVEYGRIYAALQQTQQYYPSANLALDLLCPDQASKLAASACFQPDAPLRRHKLLELQDPPHWPGGPWLSQSLYPAGRIVSYLSGNDALEEQLVLFARRVEPAIPLRGLHLPDHLLHPLERLAEQPNPQIFCLHGSHGAGKKTAAAAACSGQGRGLLVVDVPSLVALPVTEFIHLVRLAEREARLQECALYWDGFQALVGQEAHLAALVSILHEWPGIVFLGLEKPWGKLDGTIPLPITHLSFSLPDFQARHQLWEDMLGGHKNGANTAAIAGQFRFTPEQIRHAAAAALNLARQRDPENPRVETGDLFAASRRQGGQTLAELARLVPLPHSWGDLVLPPTPMAQLHELCDQVHYRAQVLETWGFSQKLALGKGLTALFSGPPGTGKTMAAGILAAELGLDLYKIDLSTVVSKYIGETEKNLAAIFSAAAACHAILFFDEADALFGKRTEVHDAHDRYANLETSYLLQQIEAYDGVTILASNLRKNMDDAFTRRMQFIIEFPFPQTAERRRIWEGIWPQATPLETDLDLDYLAGQVEVSGGHIRNIALAAAYLAASEGSAVGMAHLVRATQREYQKIGRLLKAGGFGPYQELLKSGEKMV